MASQMEGRGYPDAIVRPVTAARTITTERFAPSAALAGHLDYHWYVAWDIEQPHDQQVIPQPGSTSPPRRAGCSCTASVGARSCGT